VPVTINGETYKFVVDTGSNHTVFGGSPPHSDYSWWLTRPATCARGQLSPQEEVEYMDTMPRCQDCGDVIQVDKMVGGRRGQSIRFCERCTARYDKAEAAQKRTTIVSAIAAVIAITALLFFLLARG
jgi:hypothetical protein